jgi:hypothetical protein
MRCRVKAPGCRAQGGGFSVKGFGFRVWGFGISRLYPAARMVDVGRRRRDTANDGTHERVAAAGWLLAASSQREATGALMARAGCAPADNVDVVIAKVQC